VRRSIVKDYKVLIEFSPVINNTRFKVKIKGRGVGDVGSSNINIVAVLPDVINKAIQGSHIVREYASIRSCVSAFSSFY
jgi:hypothetical protein